MPRMSKAPSEVANEAKEEVRLAYEKWSTKLTEHSMQLAYAVIAANWAAYRPASSIIENHWAAYSLATAILFLALNLIGEWCLSHRLKRQYEYAEANQQRWKDEAERSDGKVVSWPYTSAIDRISSSLRFLKVTMPFAAAILFAYSLAVESGSSHIDVGAGSSNLHSAPSGTIATPPGAPTLTP